MNYCIDSSVQHGTRLPSPICHQQLTHPSVYEHPAAAFPCTAAPTGSRLSNPQPTRCSKQCSNFICLRPSPTPYNDCTEITSDNRIAKNHMLPIALLGPPNGSPLLRGGAPELGLRGAKATAQVEEDCLGGIGGGEGKGGGHLLPSSGIFFRVPADIFALLTSDSIATPTLPNSLMGDRTCEGRGCTPFQ